MIVDQFDDKFIYFNQLTADIELPKKFTFPFQYVPHPLALQASSELQAYLEKTDFQHNFGLNPTDSSSVTGKMFGILVVQKSDKTIGYLAAFSGKLGNSNEHAYFVPPVFDMLAANSYFLTEEAKLSELNARVKTLSNDPIYLEIRQKVADLEASSATQLTHAKTQLKVNKDVRKAQRLEALKKLNFAESEELEATLIRQSLYDKHVFNTLQDTLKSNLNQIKEELKVFDTKINDLKFIRKEKSNQLQGWLFEQYQFLDHKKNTKNLLEIFESNYFPQPPAAAGDCAAPKLLQYAFQQGYKPICMAEFWWGESPKSEIRKHQQFYPSCTGKCEPILGHMLNGIELDENPLLINTGIGKKIEIIFEDEDVLVVNKPEGLLTVPGIDIKDSVHERMKLIYPDAANNMIVHRLDMATSGILVLAKNKVSHKALQRQFLRRIVSKRYVALLDGTLELKSGEISLPLRLDLDDRPRQMVCLVQGKKAITNYTVLEVKNNTSRVHFWPVTGRTHQLRVHASHIHGLNTPIIGDDLYGKAGKRLHLHAEYIKFIHPSKGEWIEFTVPSEF